MHPIVMLEPWDPWPLLVPAAVCVLRAVLAIAGRDRRWVREIGYVLVVAGPLGAAAMLGFLSGTWDQGQRADALVELGYAEPTFGGAEGIVGGAPGAIEFAAVRDGERVEGLLVPLGDA